MTPSDKPERPDGQSGQPDADRNTSQNSPNTSVMTGEDGAGAATEVESGTEEAGAAATATTGGESFDGTDAPPPWQRAAATSANGDGDGADVPGFSSAQSIPKPSDEPDTVRTEIPSQGPDGSGRTSMSFGASARPSAQAGPSARRPSRGPRRASLQIKRLDPWSVLKLALVLSIAMFFVWMIAVAVLYGVLDGMGVWDSLNGTFTELTQPENAAEELISAGRVFGVASIIGAINIVLFTALATVSAFIYNVAADFAGGVEVTLSERE